MGDRATVAYQVSPNEYNTHYSHWGATDLNLANDISENTPLGGEPNEPEFVTALTAALTSNADEHHANITGRLVEQQDTTDVEPTPTATGLTIDEVLEHDQHGTVYFVNRDFNAHGYRAYNLPRIGKLYVHWPSRYDRHNDGELYGIQKTLATLQDANALTDEHADAVKHRILSDAEKNTTRHVLAASPALTTSDYDAYNNAFVNLTAITRVFDRMLPVAYAPVHDWMEIRNDGEWLDLTPTVREIEDYEAIDAVDPPKVQLPLGGNHLTVNHEQYHPATLPDELLDAFREYASSNTGTSEFICEAEQIVAKYAYYADVVDGYTATPKQARLDTIY